MLPRNPNGVAQVPRLPPETRDVSALLAHYAPLGRRLRRRQRWRQALLFGAGSLVSVATGLAMLDRGPGPHDARTVSTAPPATPGFPDAFERQWADLRHRELRLAEREAALEARERDLLGRIDQLDARAARLEERGRELDRGLARLAQLDERLADIAREREALKAERQELEALIQRYEALAAVAGAAAGDPVATVPPATDLPAAGEPAPDESPPGDSGAEAREMAAVPVPDEASGDSALLLAGASAVGAEELGEMRGGLRLGNDMDISFGVTRSAAINGVEQFSTSLTVDDLAGSTGGAAALQSVLIQNGPGNMVSPDVLDALSGGAGAIIQNTLDGQMIETRTILDVTIGNMGSVLNGLGAGQAVSESLRLQQQP